MRAHSECCGTLQMAAAAAEEEIKKQKSNQSRPIWKPSIAQNDGMLQSDWVPIGLNQNQEQTFFFHNVCLFHEKKTCSLFFRQALHMADVALFCVLIAIKINPIRITYAFTWIP